LAVVVDYCFWLRFIIFGFVWFFAFLAFSFFFE